MATNPTLLTMPLAQNGQKNVIPETQATAGDGRFSQSTGFPAETSLPLGAGGVAPSREDFNGMANLLGGVAFYAQKGFTFNYDATQDYYAGCVVIDPTDGLRYECIADMAAGTIAPNADTANTYWTIFKSGLDREQIPAFNHRDVITTSGTYTAPVDGWYKITVKGGGGGGAGAKNPNAQTSVTGTGGGEGGTTIAYEKLTAGDTASVVIGAGGAGSAADSGLDGQAGGNSTVTVGGNTYTGGGGGGGTYFGASGAGGTGTIIGAAGGSYHHVPQHTQSGGAGGGMGGAPSDTSIIAGVSGGGGAGGCSVANGSRYGGSAGGDGYVWFEYFAAS